MSGSPASVVSVVVGGLGILAEAAVLVFVVVKLRRVIRQVRASRTLLLVDALEDSLGRELPRRLGAILATEVAAVFYALAGWRRATPTEGFSTHRERSYLVVIGILAFLVAVETAGLHIILLHLSTTAAWIATALSSYTLLWLVGDAQAVRLHPILVDDTGISVSQGIRWRTEVPFAILGAALPVDAAPEGALRMGHLGANVLLRLDRPVWVRGPFGMRRESDRLALMVDGRERFLAEVERRRPKEPLERASA
jgi:hypothetical protein